MSNTSITNIDITDTFQTWINKTNEVIDILNEDVMLAGPLGYTIEGNTTLVGDFTATNINANTASIESITTTEITRTGNIALPVQFLSPVSINSAVENILTLQTSVGNRPIIRVINGSNVQWAIGPSEVTAGSPITIRIDGSATPQFTLTQAGNLLVSGNISPTGYFDGNLTGNVTGDIFASNGTTKVLDNGNGTSVSATFTGNVTGAVTGNVTGAVTGNVTGNVTGAVTGTVSDISNHTTDALGEGSNNLYFTQAKARGSISALVGGGLSYNATTGVMSIPDSYIRGLITGSTGVTYNSTTGAISIGQAVATTSNVQFANIIATGTITATGAISSNGDITAFASSSDIRKKENIIRIDDALNKVVSIGGYTYNFLGDNRRITGVIAQELETVLPEAVYEIDDDEFGGKSKAVRYGNVIGLLIEAIKELKAEVDELRSEQKDK